MDTPRRRTTRFALDAPRIERRGTIKDLGGVNMGRNQWGGVDRRRASFLEQIHSSSIRAIPSPSAIRKGIEEETDVDLELLLKTESEKRQKYTAESSKKEQQRKKEIEENFKEYQRKLTFIEESLAKSNLLTQKSVSLLNSYEERLVQIEESVNPIQKSTSTLKITHRNIEQTASNIKQVLDIFDIPTRIEKFIMNPPKRIEESYFRHLDELISGIDYLSRNRSYKSSEMALNRLRKILNHGLSVLEEAFISTLMKYSNFMDLNKYTEFPSTVGREGSNIASRQSSTASLALQDDSTDVSSSFSSVGGDDETSLSSSVSSYGGSSGSNRMNSVSNLQLEGVNTSSTTMLSIPSPTGGRRVFRSKRSVLSSLEARELQEGLQKKLKEIESEEIAMKESMRRGGILDLVPERIETMNSSRCEELRLFVSYLETYEQSTYLKEFTEKRSKFLLTTFKKLNPDNCIETSGTTARYIKSTHRFIALIKIILKLYESERSITINILGARQFDEIFGEVIGASLDSFIETLESIVRFERTHVFGFFVLVDIWENFQTFTPAFREVFKGQLQIGRVNEDLPECLFRMQSTLQRALEEFQEIMRKEMKTKSVPTDGTVHELTSLTLNFLKRLFEYKETVEQLLTQNRKTNKSPLADFVSSVITEAKELLQKKAKKEKKSLSNLFLLNNFYYIQQTIRSSELTLVVDMTLLAELQLLIESHIKSYRQSWTKAIEYISETFHKEANRKSAVKAKFQGFNSEIEEIFHTQKHYTIPDENLRETLKSETIDTIIPKYKTFLDRNKDIKFKNEAKYIKYSPQTLEAMLNRLFQEHGELEKKGNQQLVGKLVDGKIGQSLLKGAGTITSKVAEKTSKVTSSSAGPKASFSYKPPSTIKKSSVRSSVSRQD